MSTIDIQTIDNAREQRIEIATRLMAAWMGTWDRDIARIGEIQATAMATDMAKVCARAAITIQQEA